ncbi:universal stress protein [Umezawaea endophytica]|uniref:Universal stress protein n=1 Tax=Umezawaea endophytica TaxID=1654476 RepID=A0A9X2VXZ3_9PSEU|nr:universal stress protein [Umezawaea endophytica]MCS7484744.1 universal stress protein [Umezawaea endophytica]
MSEQKAIVVGLDGSEAAQHALDWALDEALIRGCPVKAVRVWNFEPMSDWVPTSLQEVRTRAVEALAESVRTAVAGRSTVPPVEQVTTEGDPADELVRVASDAALLVVAGHRGEHLRKIVLGSVSSACVRRSHVPVVVLPPKIEWTAAAEDAEKARA